MIKPGAGPRLVKMRSCISMEPTSLALPTLSMTLGLLESRQHHHHKNTKPGSLGPHVASPKYLPFATSCDHVSPTILEPTGTVTVPVRMYEPASTKRILPWLPYSAVWKAAVSSVTPSPL